jgi:hypothetical protein
MANHSVLSRTGSKKEQESSAFFCIWRIDTVAVKRSDPRNALRLRTETPNDFIGSLAEVEGYRNQHESLTNQAATGV